MKRRQILLLYQLLIGASDTSTGLLLLVAPALTLQLMRLEPADAALPYLSYIGAFVLSTAPSWKSSGSSRRSPAPA